MQLENHSTETQKPLKNLSIDDLHIKTLEIARHEQCATLELLHHLIEVKERLVFALK